MLNIPFNPILLNIGSGNGLVPDGTKPLPKPMFSITEVVRHYPVDIITKIYWNRTRLKLQPHFPGVNELNKVNAMSVEGQHLAL